MDPVHRPAPAADYHLAAIVRSCEDAIVSKGLDGIVTSWNPAAERIFGFTAAEVIGRSIRLIVPDDRQDEEDEVLRKITAGETIEHYETVRRRKDGTLLQVALTISPIHDLEGRIVGASKIARDITERKRIEAELASATEKLEVLFQESVAANRMKDEFLAVLSHELRTPLNAILGWSQVLAHRTEEPALIARGLAAISRNVEAQTRLIEDLLDVSRIISGKLRIETQPIALAPVVEAAVDAVRPAAEAKQIRLGRALGCADLVIGDPDRLQQVFWNLLSNAVKFTPRGGHVEVMLSRVDSHAEIVVRDDGIGMSEEFVAHCFERFRQADSTARRTAGGLGLGLAIARDLVELHGGTLTAESAGEGKGSSFVVNLPTPFADFSLAGARPGRAGGPLPRPAAPDLTGLRVLMVDDDAASRELVLQILAPMGAEVQVAAGAAEGFAAFVLWRPDVLLSDIGMPGEEGYSLIAKVRALPGEEGGGTPAAALTAYQNIRVRVLEAGFNLYLVKPIEPIRLANSIASLTGRTPAAAL